MKYNCTFCKVEFEARPSKKRIYCSNKCQHEHLLLESIKKSKVSSRTWKKYLIYSSGTICMVCKNSKWNNQSIPIELDHIDGDSTNNKLENLRLICPNCHAQTPTYKNRNKGKGRYFRRTRYNSGKSY